MHCPNYGNCQLIHIAGFVESESLREEYMQSYCTNPQEHWQCCKRYQTNSVLHFCPDFVFPDTTLNLSEILDKFDEEPLKTNDL